LVTLKLALSLDGKLAATDGSSRWITGEMARRRVHERRAASDGILIGAGTVLSDDPLLTVRDVAAPRQPARVLCDSTGRVPVTSQIFGRGEVIVMTTIACPHETKMRWKASGAEVVVVPQAPTSGVDLDAVLGDLGGRGWLELYCEGGAALATSLVRSDLVDRLELNYGPLLVGATGVGLGDLGIETMSDSIRWHTTDVARLGDDAVITLERGA
jgi:riboflavin-specific deaminase-like protein